MIPPRIYRDKVRNHFDELAPFYDSIKAKNRIYYQSLKRFIQEAIPPAKRVLDIGTGTGEILNYLRPEYGVGIDLSPRSVALAQSKFPGLIFRAAALEDFETEERFDFIVLADVIEHLEEPLEIFSHVRKLCGPETLVVMTMANPLWEWILEILEALKLKMVEGPNRRVSNQMVLKSAGEASFKLVSRDFYLLFPLEIPLLSRWLNNSLGRIPFLRKLCLIERFIFKPTNS